MTKNLGFVEKIVKMESYLETSGASQGTENKNKSIKIQRNNSEKTSFFYIPSRPSSRSKSLTNHLVIFWCRIFHCWIWERKVLFCSITCGSMKYDGFSLATDMQFHHRFWVLCFSWQFNPMRCVSPSDILKQYPK